MKWYERPAVLDYIVQSYAGVDVVDGRRQRQFLWEEGGDLVIGNARAFTDHVGQRFGLSLTETEWSAVHEALRAMGDVVHGYSARTTERGKRFKNQEPRKHVVRRGTAGGEGEKK